jgi:flagellar basal body-associated protein FliL
MIHVVYGPILLNQRTHAMIKKALGFTALYLLPAILVIGGFSAGHLLYPAESDRLVGHLIETGKIPDPEAEVQLDANGQPIDPALLLPTYRYFEMVMPFTGNFSDSERLYKIQLAFSIHKSRMESDGIITKLQELEPQIRPVIVTELIGLTDEMLSSSENRAELLGRLLIVVNDELIKLELGAVVEDIVITDLALT